MEGGRCSKVASFVEDLVDWFNAGLRPGVLHEEVH